VLNSHEYQVPTATYDGAARVRAILVTSLSIVEVHEFDGIP
jgi:hypothetical protein